MTEELTGDDVALLMEQLRSVLNICFCNIVEEPEQNLFPKSQIIATEFLVKCMNVNARNSLLVTTHSPFVLSVLNNMIFAAKINSKTVEPSLYVDSNDFSAYMISGGKITSVFDSGTGVMDTAVIDDCATMLNQRFDDLYEEQING